MPFVYRLCPGDVLSTTRLHQALQKLIIKHQSLRTSLVFDTQTNMLMQRIIHPNENFNKSIIYIHRKLYTKQMNN